MCDHLANLLESNAVEHVVSRILLHDDDELRLHKHYYKDRTKKNEMPHWNLLNSNIGHEDWMLLRRLTHSWVH